MNPPSPPGLPVEEEDDGQFEAGDPLRPWLAPLRRHVVAGCLAVVVWLVVMCAGLMLESFPWRREAAVRLQNALCVPRDEPLCTTRPESAHSAVGSSFVIAIAALSYTPVNSLLLALAAAVAGGCFSCAYAKHALRMSYRIRGKAEYRRRLQAHVAEVIYKTESPLVSMFRGFLAYLAVLITWSVIDPRTFTSPSSDQYVKFAVFVSAIALVVGYDPRNSQWLMRLVCDHARSLSSQDDHPGCRRKDDNAT